MGYLGSTLKAQLNKRGWKAVDLTRKTGLQQSWLSRITRGQQTYTEHADFIKIVQCFAKDENGDPSPGDQAQIIAARMLDHRVGPSAELIQVSVRPPSGSARPVKSRLSPEALRAFDFLMTHPPSDKVEPLVINMARLLGMPERPPT
jgi:hypothetical protein